MNKMNALEFYKSHESAPLPNVGDLVSLTVEELCELMEQYHQSKVNNGVLDDVKVCDRCDGKGNVWYFPDESNFHTEIPCPKCRS